MKRVKLTLLALGFGAAVALMTIAGCGDKSGSTPDTTTPAEARAIAKEAYTYGYPMVDSYRILNAYFVNRENPEYKAPWNQILNIPRVYTPHDKAVQTPNSDTPYSMVGMDLRAEPILLTVPRTDKKRYFSIQLVDLYAFNFDYIGSRATGNEGGSFLIAGPGWNDETPKGVKKVIRSETELTLAVYRTQLFNPGDLDNVKKVQKGYKAQPLSSLLRPSMGDARHRDGEVSRLSAPAVARLEPQAINKARIQS